MKKIISMFKKEFYRYASIKDSFICIYGSQINSSKKLNSDIDVFFVLKNPKSIDFKILEKKFIDFHKKNNLKIDNEVPYKNKLVVSYSDVSEAVKLKCFRKARGGFIVPKIRKSNSFLNSKEVRERIILYSLTAPHVFLGKDRSSYNNFKKEAQKNLMFLARDLLRHRKPSKEAILEILLRGNAGEEGELYLGYKRIGKVIKYLKKIIADNIGNLFM
jgi:hypothetical protein